MNFQQDDNNEQSSKKTIWEILNKIRAASYRVGFNLWDLYKPLDPNKLNQISEAKFISILSGTLRNVIGLDDFEINEVTNYFKVDSGRVQYNQFCSLIHEVKNNKQTDEENEDDIDVFEINKLSKEDERIHLMLLTKIACTVNERKLKIQPYFQQYELLKKKAGLVTRSSFGRVLSFHGIKMSNKEYVILIKRYNVDSYRISYISFLKELDEIYKNLENNHMFDLAGNILPRFPGQLEHFHLQMMPRPELTSQKTDHLVGIAKVLKPGWEGILTPQMTLIVIRKIKNHIYQEKLRVGSLLQNFDKTCCGRITKNNFIGCLNYIVNSLANQRLVISDKELKALCDLYEDETNSDRVVWKVFLRDMEQDLDEEELKRWPNERENLKTLREEKTPCKPGPEIPELPYSLEEFLIDVKKKLQNKGELRMDPILMDLDTKSTGYVTRHQIERSFKIVGIFPTDYEIDLLESKYATEKGYFFRDFLKDLSAINTTKSFEKNKSIKNSNARNVSTINKFQQEKEENIVEVLAKIKKKLICDRVQLIEFIKQHDKLKKGTVTKDNFIRSLDQCKLELTPKEIENIVNVYCLSEDENLIKYKNFCTSVDEESIKPCLERLPLKEAINQVLIKPLRLKHQFINFDERITLAVAIKKISLKISLGNLDYFKSLDKDGTGTINRSTFINTLYNLKILQLLTIKEIEVIIKGFGIQNKNNIELDYISFLNAIDIVFKRQKAAS